MDRKAVACVHDRFTNLAGPHKLMVIDVGDLADRTSLGQMAPGPIPAEQRSNEDDDMPKIHPFLWFDDQAEDAAEFYVSLFPNSKILSVQRNGPDGSILTVAFELDGQAVTGLNGGPMFRHSEAFSFVIDCDGQDEVDRYWAALTADGGAESQCGWCKDRFGLSWQVIPKQLFETIGGPDKAGAQRALDAMMQMGKLDVARLQAAYAG